MRNALFMLVLAACADTTEPVPTPTPQARLVDAAAEITAAAAAAERAGYRVMITVQTSDSIAPRVGVVLFPR